MRREYIGIAIGMSCLLVAAVVGAQQAPPPKVANIDQNVRLGRRGVDRMHTMVKKGFDDLEAARKAQKINWVNCVNEALSPMKGLLRLAESQFLALQEAASRKDAKGVEHELIKLQIAQGKVEELNGRLKGCGGADNGIIDGRPWVKKTVDPNLPDVDPTEGLKDLAPSLESPPSASPFFN